jgi:hypothetical protein
MALYGLFLAFLAIFNSYQNTPAVAIIGAALLRHNTRHTEAAE